MPTAARRPRIVVVEDEPAVLQVLERQLDKLGWDVFPSPGAYDALAILNGVKGDVEALLTDVDLPGMSGVELTTEVRKRYLEVVVVLMSAASQEASDRQAGSLSILRKPFAMQTLAEALSMAKISI